MEDADTPKVNSSSSPVLVNPPAVKKPSSWVEEKFGVTDKKGRISIKIPKIPINSKIISVDTIKSKGRTIVVPPPSDSTVNSSNKVSSSTYSSIVESNFMNKCLFHNTEIHVNMIRREDKVKPNNNFEENNNRFKPNNHTSNLFT